MDMYKLRFTILQQEILRFLFIKAGESFNARALARLLDVSPTAISKSLKLLEKEKLIAVARDKTSNRLSIGMNRENPFAFCMKRAENLKLLYESGLVDSLSERFPGATLMLFGSYAFGEDLTNSDIDIAVIGDEKNIDTTRFEKLLERKVSLHFFDSLEKINKHLRENILAGILLKGGIKP